MKNFTELVVSAFGQEIDFYGSDLGVRYALEEIATLQRVLEYVKVRTVVVQAGGALGIFPKYLAARFANVYTFEPDPESFRVLCMNCPEPNVWRMQAALGARGSGPVYFSATRRDGKAETHEGTRHVVTGRRDGAIQAVPGPTPSISIDSLNLPALDLLYLDVEGLEPLALDGAGLTIMRHMPVVVVEMNKQLQLAGFQENSVTGLMTECGYGERARIGSDVVFMPKRR